MESLFFNFLCLFLSAGYCYASDTELSLQDNTLKGRWQSTHFLLPLNEERHTAADVPCFTPPRFVPVLSEDPFAKETDTFPTAPVAERPASVPVFGLHRSSSSNNLSQLIKRMSFNTERNQALSPKTALRNQCEQTRACLALLCPLCADPAQMPQPHDIHTTVDLLTALLEQLKLSLTSHKNRLERQKTGKVVTFSSAAPKINDAIHHPEKSLDSKVYNFLGERTDQDYDRHLQEEAERDEQKRSALSLLCSCLNTFGDNELKRKVCRLNEDTLDHCTLHNLLTEFGDDKMIKTMQHLLLEQNYQELENTVLHYGIVLLRKQHQKTTC